MTLGQVFGERTRRIARLGCAGMLLAAAGCFASSSPVLDRFPYLEPGRRPKPFEIGMSQDAPDLPAGPVTLADAVKAAIGRNPEIARARALWLAQAASATSAASLPDPMVKFEQMMVPGTVRAGLKTMVVQPIPFPPAIAARAGIARRKADAAWAAYDQSVRDVVYETKVAWFELAYLRRAVETVGQAQALAEELAAIAEAGRARDQATLFDSLKARGQTAQLMYDRIVLEELLSVETARLNSLLDRPPDAPVGPMEAVPFRRLDTPLDSLYTIALEHSQELLQADGNVRAMQKEAELSGLESFPELEVGFNYNARDPWLGGSGMGSEFWEFTLGFSLPIWMHRNAARVREAERRLDAELHAKRGEINRVLLRVKTAHYRLVSTERLLALYRDTLLPQAEDAVRKSEEWFRAKGESLSKFLEAQSVLANFQLAALRAEADCQQAIARLEMATGGKAELGADEAGGR